MHWITQHKLLFVGVVVVIAGMVWYGLSQSAEPVPTITTITPVGEPGSGNAEQELVATLLTLRAVQLTGAIFKDPAFMNLRDFGTTIIAEPIGRPNPFAPLGVNVSASAASTNTSTQR